MTSWYPNLQISSQRGPLKQLQQPPRPHGRTIKRPFRACKPKVTLSRYSRAKQLEQNYGIDCITVWRQGRNPKKRLPRAIRLSLRTSVCDTEAFQQWIENQTLVHNAVRLNLWVLARRLTKKIMGMDLPISARPCAMPVRSDRRRRPCARYIVCRFPRSLRPRAGLSASATRWHWARTAIHPEQVAIINRCFGPSAEQIAEAR
jgi:predicted DNA-binding transcriptional regulator AlpA